MLLGSEQRMLLCSTSSSSSSSLQPSMSQLQPAQQGQRHQSSVLQETATEPEIKLAFHGTSNQLSIHVIEARNLRSQSAQKCNSFVRIGFSPETGTSRSARWQTGPAPNTDFPLFDRHFAIDLPPPPAPTAAADSTAWRSRGLMVSVWSQIHNGGFSEFLGCVTFPMDSLVGVHKPSIWYRLVNEMTASACATSSTSTSNNAAANAAAQPMLSAAPPGGFELKEALIRRAPDRGLGFTVAGSGPSHVSKVERRSPADAAGVRAGDYIVRVDGRRVADTDNETVVRLLRNTGGAASVRLLLGRCRSGGSSGSQQQLMVASASSTSGMTSSSAVAKSPSLPLSYCQQLMDKQQHHQQQHQHQHSHSQLKQVQQHQSGATQQSAAALKRDIHSLYEMSSTKNGSITSCTALQAAPAGYQMQFAYKEQLIVRPSEMLMHSGSLSLADSKTGAAPIRIFLFPDLLLLAKAGGSHSQPERNQELFAYELLRDPIHIHQITQCFVLKGNSDLSIKYIGPDGRLHQHLRLRCQAGERDCHVWCRRIQDRLLQTVIL